MKNFLKDFFDGQKVAVFNNYKFYRNVGRVENTESEYFDFKRLVNDSAFKRDKYLFKADTVLYGDFKKFAHYMNASIEKLYSNILNDKVMAQEKHIPIIVVDNKNIANYRTFNLTEAQGLYTELAKVEPFNLKSIIHFSKTFGLPCGELFSPQLTNKAFESKYMFTPITNYMELNLMLMEYRLAFNMLKNIVTKNVDGIRKREISYLELILKYKPLSEHEIASIKSYINDYKNYDEELILELEISDLLSIFNNYKTANLFNFFVDFHDGNYFVRNRFSNLFQYAYFQIFNGLMNKVHFKECKYCGHPFEAQNNKMQFCPILPFRGRSSCEMAYHNNEKGKKIFNNSNQRRDDSNE